MDIIILQKPIPGEQPGGSAWLEGKPFDLGNGHCRDILKGGGVLRDALDNRGLLGAPAGVDRVRHEAAECVALG
ncbi:MAG: hypothetical protein H7343_12000 [Undibacterium sp.]|nr:hypothetical protein [Opitutaceae bacterium]